MSYYTEERYLSEAACDEFEGTGLTALWLESRGLGLQEDWGSELCIGQEPADLWGLSGDIPSLY